MTRAFTILAAGFVISMTFIWLFDLQDATHGSRSQAAREMDNPRLPMDGQRGFTED
jgi:hypothetical protein